MRNNDFMIIEVIIKSLFIERFRYLKEKNVLENVFYLFWTFIGGLSQKSYHYIALKVEYLHIFNF